MCSNYRPVSRSDRLLQHLGHHPRYESGEHASWRIGLKNWVPFAIAGIRAEWTDPATGEEVLRRGGWWGSIRLRGWRLLRMGGGGFGVVLMGRHPDQLALRHDTFHT